MTTYRVQFYQSTYSADGHSIKRLMRQVDVVAECPSQALIEAQAGGCAGADSVEVRALVADPRTGDHTPRAA